MIMKNVSELKGGEYLAKPVCLGSEIVLIYEGTCLKEEYIKKLNELGVQYVYVREDENSECGNEEEKQRERDKISGDYKERVRDLLERHIYTSRSELMEIKFIAQDIILSIINEDAVVEQIENMRNHKADIYEHSLNVCALSVLIGIKSKMDMQEVHDMALGSILHDIGFRYIPISYEGRNLEDLERKELMEYKKHTIYGYMAVEYEQWLSQTAKEIILSHHERVSGSGYPLKKRDIMTTTKIVSICDEYDSYLCGLGREPMKVYQVIEHLKAVKGVDFEPGVVDIFLECISAYPNGTTVETNEGEVGIVIKQNSGFKERPVIRIIQDKNGNNIKGNMEKDLMKYLNIFIANVIE